MPMRYAERARSAGVADLLRTLQMQMLDEIERGVVTDNLSARNRAILLLSVGEAYGRASEKGY